MDEDIQDTRRKISVKKYRRSDKGKVSSSKSNKIQFAKRRQAIVYFIGKDIKLYDLLTQKKGATTYSKILLIAVKEWLIRNV